MSLETSLALEHGSSEGHEMLKRNDKYHSIADDVTIPKIKFLSKFSKFSNGIGPIVNMARENKS